MSGRSYDLCPVFPKLNKFLNFWLEKLEGPLHSVTVATARLIKPADILRHRRRVQAALNYPRHCEEANGSGPKWPAR